MGADPQNREPVLDISTLAPERPVIRIRTAEHPDGDLWELRVEKELSLTQLAEMQQLAKSVEKLDEDMDEEQARLLEGHVDELLDIAFIRSWRADPPIGVGPMLMHDKVAIARAFIEACFGIDLAALEAEQAKKPRPRSKARRTGAK